MNQIVKFPTRGHNTLDVICVPLNMHFVSFSVQKLPPLGRSDHCAILLRTETRQIIKKTITLRDYSPKHSAHFAESISLINWKKIFCGLRDVNDMAEIFQLNLKYVFDDSFPTKTVTVSSRDPPWVTPHVKFLMKQKDRAYHKGKIFHYMSFRERLIQAIKSSKQKYYQDVTNKNPKRRWAHINNIVKPKQSSLTLTQEKINEINDTFAQVFEPIQTKNIHHIQSSSLCQIKIDESEVFEVIKSIKSNASGPDNLPGFIFRKYADILSSPICVIINESFQKGIFPIIWKKCKCHSSP